MTSAAPKPASSFDAQAEAARLLVLEARSLRQKHGHLIIEFDDREAALHGVEQALRDMQSWPGDKNRVAAYIDSENLKQALDGAMSAAESASTQPHTDHAVNIIEDGLRSMRSVSHVQGVARAAAKARRNRQHKERGEPLEEPTSVMEVPLLEQRDLRTALVAARGLRESEKTLVQLRSLFGGHALDTNLWAFDFGILDGDYGCPDEQRRELHRRSIYDGHYDFGWCFGCPLLQDNSCRYQRKALRKPGLIVSYNGEQSMGRIVSVLLGPVPASKHVADETRLAEIKAIATAEFDADAAQLVEDIAAGKPVDVDAANRHALAAHRLRRESAERVSELRDTRHTLEQVTSKTREQLDELASLRARFRAEIQRRRDLCGLRTIFEVGAWEAGGGKRPSRQSLSRPLITPPLIGHFVAFTDNASPWASVLTPLGARKVKWTAVESLLREPERAQRKDVMVELVEAAVAIVADGQKLAQQRIAERLGITKAAVSERLRANGWKWPWVKELAGRLAAGSTGLGEEVGIITEELE